MDTKSLTTKENLLEEILGDATDGFLEILLNCMDLAFWFSRHFRKNIEKFEATYVFRSADGRVGSTAVFANGDLKVKDNAVEHGWTIRVTFKSAKALRNFLFSKDQDILDSLLKNEVTTEGNINYLYKFGYLAKHLLHNLPSL